MNYSNIENKKNDSETSYSRSNSLNESYRPGVNVLPVPGDSTTSIPPPGTESAYETTLHETPYTTGTKEGSKYENGSFTSPLESYPPGEPPSYIPSISDINVKSFELEQKGLKSKAISVIAFEGCLNKFIYIWEKSGVSYWAFLVRFDKTYVSGYHWERNSWSYLNLNITDIEYFICSRYEFELLCDKNSVKQCHYRDTSSIKLEYSLNQTKEIYTKDIISFDIPEAKHLSVLSNIGNVNNRLVKINISSVKRRTSYYKICLNFFYPYYLDMVTKDYLIKTIDESSAVIYNIFSWDKFRSNLNYITLSDLLNDCNNLINQALKEFSITFNKNIIHCPNYNNLNKVLTFNIVNERITSKWT